MTTRALTLLCLALLPLPLTLDDACGQEPDAAASIEELTAETRESLVVISQIGRDESDRGLGTGFIISDDGLIVTCNHVIGDSRELMVRLASGEEFPATAVHAWDRTLDLAILRIAPGDKPLKPLELGDSDQLSAGQRVVTIGNPHGLSFSVVEGLVSAIREIEEGGAPMIQLAIPVEPGNSGGPLIGLDGKVYGVISMKSTVTDNIGFATPSNSLQPLINKPNSVPMKNWVTIGALDPRQWKDSMGARWRQRAGKISVDSPGKGFGGRSLCIAQREVPEPPYEIEVSVRLDDESGAAGLAFESDGGDLHYGFYPSAGEIRLTRFDGPDVYSWQVLKQVATPAYLPGEWNHLRVRVTDESITGIVNGEVVVEIDDRELRGGKAGLAKFRQTRAEFKGFRIGRDLSPLEPDPVTVEKVERQLDELAAEHDQFDQLDQLGQLAENSATVRELLERRRKALAAEIAALDRLGDAVHCKSLETQLLAELDKPDEADIDLTRAALLVSKLDHPELDVDAYCAEIDLLAEGASAAAASAGSASEKLRALSGFLFESNGFHGSRGAYYSRSNSYLNEVIDDREGIPITLSILYIELANRLGIEGVGGLGLPGHFVVRHDEVRKADGGDGDDGGGAPVETRQIIDVFGGGKFVSDDEAGELAGLIPALGESPDQYDISSKREIITRMLANLKAIAIDERQPLQAIRYANLSLALNPDNPAERLSRALLLAQADQPRLAIPDLDWIFEKEPEGIDLDRLREFYEHLRRQQSP